MRVSSHPPILIDVRSLLAKLAAVRRATIARDLALGLVLTITVVFSIAGTANYVYSVKRDTAALYDKATEIMDNLASVLVTPLWNLNTDEINKIVNVYRQSGIVLDIKLVDDAGEELVKPRKRPDAAFLEMSRIIHHDATPIGRVTVYFSDADITAKQAEIASYSAIVFACLTFALIFATSLLLGRFLRAPFDKLKKGLEVISGGDYSHMIEPARQTDVNAITDKVNLMAREIAKRESALEENRAKLEILNQAILDIFSCSDTESLIRSTMQLTHKVCGVDRGWFIGRREQSTADAEAQESTVIPKPLKCVRGVISQATDAELEGVVGQHDNEKIFTFAIESRYIVVGRMTLAFDEPTDPSIASLLKSLMSLATLAMVRQSFIRETAFISAELQVAEAVQRSMLPEESRLPASATVAYHYEPVLRVGGDWFSVIGTKDGSSLYVILGDVTGHGLAQGLVTTAMAGALQIIESSIRDFGGVNPYRPSQIVTELKKVINKIAGKSNLRMTCVAARIDFTDGKLFICNAGHTFPLRLHHPTDADVEAHSLARNQQVMLGEVDYDRPDHIYTDAEYAFSAGDLLLFYTDGLTEAVDKAGKPFVRKFQRHFTRKLDKRSAAQVKDSVMAMWREHIQDAPVKDDMCVLVVGKRPDAAEDVVKAS